MKNDDGDNNNKTKNIEVPGSLNLVAFFRATHKGARGGKNMRVG